MAFSRQIIRFWRFFKKKWLKFRKIDSLIKSVKLKCVKLNLVEIFRKSKQMRTWNSLSISLAPQFQMSTLSTFCRFIIKDRETFFSSAQRSQMVWQILMRTSYDDDDSDRVGIVRLLSNGVFNAAYPLHDGRAMKDDNKSHLCSRRVSTFRVYN